MCQVEKEHYNFIEYVSKERWMSYYYQIKEIMNCNVKQILIIGKGDGIISNVLKNSEGGGKYEVTTFDYDKELKPDIVGDVRYIQKYLSHQYDCIICCQVLEHLEWDYFEDIIKQLSLACRNRLILSLPQRNFNFRYKIDFPKIHIKKLFTVPRLFEKSFKPNGEHYWEVNCKFHSKKIIRDVVKRYFRIINEYSVFEHPYHWFLILNKKENSVEKEKLTL